MARRAEMDWTNHKVVQGQEALDNRLCTANHRSDNRLWTDALCNNDWHLGKQPQMMVFRCQRCCTQLKMDMEHVLNHTHLIRRRTWKHMTHTAQIWSDIATCPHEWPWTQELNSPPILDAHAAIAHPSGLFHTRRWGKQLCGRPLRVQGTPPNRRHAHGDSLSMLRMWIADASPTHVHGNCGNREAYGCHLPMWSIPTNMRQIRPQLKLLHVN